MSNPAQDEFNSLVATQSPRFTQHPEDAASHTSNEDTSYAQSSSTLVPSTANSPHESSKNSLRSSAYNTHDSSGEDSDIENQIPLRKNTPYYIPNNHGYNENTGPKGVIADARAFERERRLGNKITYVRTEGMVLPKMQHLQLRQEEHTSAGAKNNKSNDSDQDEEDDEDDDFMRHWREKRGEEIKSGKWNGTYAVRRKGRYGSMKTVDAFGFLEALERTPRDTVVAIYVFDELSPVSEGYHTHLKLLAGRYADVRFIALHYEDAEMEPAGVPALLAYRNGEQFASLTPLGDEVPHTDDVASSLESSLRRGGIL